MFLRHIQPCTDSKDSRYLGTLVQLFIQAVPPSQVMVSDNGGPLDHATNDPLRGGKHTYWEGGVRVAAFISGPALLTAGLPKQRMGSSWDGMAHSSDW